MTDFWDIEAIKKYRADMAAQSAEIREMKIRDMIERPLKCQHLIDAMDIIKQDGVFYINHPDAWEVEMEAFRRQGFLVEPYMRTGDVTTWKISVP